MNWLTLTRQNGGKVYVNFDKVQSFYTTGFKDNNAGLPLTKIVYAETTGYLDADMVKETCEQINTQLTHL